LHKSPTPSSRRASYDVGSAGLLSSVRTSAEYLEARPYSSRIVTPPTSRFFHNASGTTMAPPAARALTSMLIGESDKLSFLPESFTEHVQAAHYDALRCGRSVASHPGCAAPLAGRPSGQYSPASRRPTGAQVNRSSSLGPVSSNRIRPRARPSASKTLQRLPQMCVARGVKSCDFHMFA
jgi:hypothetical protein